MHGEDRNREQRTKNGSRPHLHAEHDVQAESATGDVADVEGKATESNQQRDERAEPGRNQIADILGATSRGRNDTPDIQLRTNVDQDRSQNREAETRAEL